MSCRTATTSTTQTADAPRNEISPINRLPPETLTQIADFSCRTSDQAATTTQVFRYWRSVFTSYPWVWTDVTVKTATPLCRVTIALKNSSELTLRLNLQIYLDESDTAHHPHCMASTYSLFRFANFRPHLEPYHGRIQRLRIRFLYHDNTYDRAVTKLIQHPLFQWSFDILDSLSLFVADACHTWYRPYVFPGSSAKIEGNFPQLRSLRLFSIKQVLQPELRCPMLKSLSIDLPDCNNGYHTTLRDQELGFLKQHSTLTSVIIREQPVEFCRVKSITLSGGSSGISLKNGMRSASLRVTKSLTI